MSLRVISGKNSLATQYHTLIHPETCIKYKLNPDGFIKLKNDDRSIIVHYQSFETMNKDSIMIDSRTHALTLYIGNNEFITFDKILESPPMTKISVRLRKCHTIINYPQLKQALYIAPGYYIICPEGIGIVESGQGIYLYNYKDVMSDLLTSENISHKDAVILSEMTPTTININFCHMGIGGLKEQMTTLIRQVLISRIIPQSMRDEYDVKDIKGILLYGPPGTGKTLIARNIGKIIPNAVITKVNGPELSSKFVGETESNIRRIFDNAKNDAKKLHVIIFDEIDAVGERRGDGSNSYDDKALTQLLTMIDGLDSANNVLIIGITNRKDVLDPALTRAGRLECHIEIPLPTEIGRSEILDIYLNPMRNKKLAIDIDSIAWARTLDGYSGADIESFIGRAKNLALLRNCDIDESSIKANNTQETKLAFITNDDLINAFTSFQPTFSKNDDTVQRYTSNYPLEDPDDLIVIKETIHNIMLLNMTKPYIVKDMITIEEIDENVRARACHLACMLQLPYIRYVSYNDFLGKNSNQNCSILNDAYINCLQAERAVLILDSLSDVGDRALVLRERFIINNPLPKGKKLIIIYLTGVSY
jgi:vesicle-fusing ATPase